MRCETCCFWDQQRAWGEKKDKAACRRNPPSIRQGRLSCDESGEWPSTNKSDWCGHYSSLIVVEGFQMKTESAG